MLLRNRLALVLAFVLSLTIYVAEASAKKVEIVISKVSQKMTVKVDGATEYVWLVSTGAARYETPSGSFKIFRMEEDYFSKEWDNAPMPNAMFFTARGHAIHGSFQTKSLGRRASHGCVRLAPENAKKLYALVQEAGYGNTSVAVKGGFFDFSGGTSRSLAEVGSDIDKVTKKKPSRGLFWSFGQTKKKPDAKDAKKKDVKPKKVAAAKKPDVKAKKVAAVDAKKPEVKAKKAAEKCVVKDGKKLCGKAPAV